MGFEHYLGTDKHKEDVYIAGILGRERNPHYLLKIYGDGSTPPLCKCGCGKPVSRNKLDHKKWNIYINNHHTPKTRIKEWHMKMKEEDPDRYYKLLSYGGKNWHKEFKERNPEKYKEFQSKGMKSFHKKYPDFASKNSRRIHKMIPDLGKRCFRGRLKNLPYKFMGISFSSKTERDVAKLRFELLGIIPINKVNCHVMIRNKEFDFEQFGFIQEHHPNTQMLYKSLPQEEYYKQRREILDSNGHKNSELIVTENEKEAKELYEWLKDRIEVVV